MMQTKKITIDGVRIEAAALPRELRPLLAYAAEWCFLNERTPLDDLEFKPEEEIREFVNACKSRLHVLEDYCLDEDHETPRPDEVVLFKAMYENFLVARSYLWAIDYQPGHASNRLPVFNHD